MKYTILIGLLSTFALAQEPVLLHSSKTRYQGVPNVGIAEVTEEKDHMPGNNELGFFSKPIGGNLEWCRIRTKLACDYGLGGAKELKLRPVKLFVENKHYLGKTDDSGLLDLIFRCESEDKKKKFKIKIENHSVDFILASIPKEILITDRDCK